MPASILLLDIVSLFIFRLSAVIPLLFKFLELISRLFARIFPVLFILLLIARLIFCPSRIFVFKLLPVILTLFADILLLSAFPILSVRFPAVSSLFLKLVDDIFTF